MTFRDDLQKLGNLHQQGVLTDDEFARAKARVLSGAASLGQQAPAIAALNGLQRSRGDRWLGGVCAGLAQMTGLAAWMWRLIFVLLVFCAGTGVLAYLLLWIFVPEEPAPLGGFGPVQTS